MSGPTPTSAEAASWTAANNAQCKSIANTAPFYWEIGDVNGAMASGQVGSNAPAADTQMSIASASKWMYGAYVVQKRGGNLTTQDIPFLNFTSGYVNLSSHGECLLDATVNACMQGIKGTQDPAAVGKFYYDSGHMEEHARSVMGLGSMDGDALSREIEPVLETGTSSIPIHYSEPLLAGGISTSANAYARFLRNILSGNLKMRQALGQNAVCANPTDPSCPTALSSPLPNGKNWHYAVGHWVEDDGSFSSAGAFGFYPWIDKDAHYYGVVARKALISLAQDGLESAECGQTIRRAWNTGQHQP